MNRGRRVRSAARAARRVAVGRCSGWGAGWEVGLTLAILALTVACGDKRDGPEAAVDVRSQGAGSSRSRLAAANTRAGASDLEAPAKVASKLVWGDEMLWSGGELTRSKTVALSALVDDTRYSTVAGEWPQSVPRLGNNPEQILALGPDIVLLAGFTAAEYRAAIAGHISELEFEAFTGFAAHRRAIRTLAQRLDQPSLATRALATFDGEHERLARQTRETAGTAASRWPTCLLWQFDSTAGSDTTFSDAVELAGCRNRAAMAGVSGHHRVDVEQMLAWNPDFIVLSCGEAGCEAAVTQFVERPGIRRLSAVTQGRIVAIPPPFLSTTGLGMLELAGRIHDGVHGVPGASASGSTARDPRVHE